MSQMCYSSLQTRAIHSRVQCCRQTVRRGSQVVVRYSERNIESVEAHEGLYESALQHARVNDFAVARADFLRLTTVFPEACKGWVSWAQMEKRIGDSDSFERCRAILQKGLQHNKKSACLVQAWGLMELQRGNFLPALMMLERAVLLQPSCSPVLKWRQVDQARKTVGSNPTRQRNMGKIA